jgi:hypothetical protein
VSVSVCIYVYDECTRKCLMMGNTESMRHWDVEGLEKLFQERLAMERKADQEELEIVKRRLSNFVEEEESRSEKWRQRMEAEKETTTEWKGRAGQLEVQVSSLRDEFSRVEHSSDRMQQMLTLEKERSLHNEEAVRKAKQQTHEWESKWKGAEDADAEKRFAASSTPNMHLHTFDGFLTLQFDVHTLSFKSLNPLSHRISQQAFG